MSDSVPLAARAGTATLWKGAQLVGVKLIFLVRLVVLARLLTPEAFGLVAVALIPLGLLLSVSDFGMVPALVQAEGAERRHFDSAWTVGVVRALAVGVLVAASAPLVAQLALEPRATDLIRALAARPLLDAAASIKVAHLTRRLEFRSLALIQLSGALVNTVVSIALAPALGAWALVLGILAGSCGYLCASYLVAPHLPRLRIDRDAAGALIRFGRWIFVTGVLSVAGSAFLRLLVSRHLGAAELGLYFLAASLAFLPAELASEVAGAVAFPVYARLRSDAERTVRAFRAALSGLCALVAPVFLLLIALAPSLVREVLGSRWEGTEPIIRLLALAALIGLLGEVTVPLFKGLGHPSRVALLEAIQSSLLILLVWALVGRHGLVGAAAAWIPAVTASQLLALVLLRRLLPRPLAGLRLRVLIIGAAGFAGAVLAWAIDLAVSGLSGLILAAVVGGGISLALLAAADRLLDIGLTTTVESLFPRLAERLRLRSGDGRPG